MPRATSQPPPHPQQGIFNTLAATLAHNVERQEPSWRPPTGRDAHPKHHGCVKGRFIVEPDLPATLRRGVCTEPSTSYEIWIRFSNAFKRRHDLTWDARGMAIKLLDAGIPIPAADRSRDDEANSGLGTQDFLMVSHPVFFARTADDFVDFPATVAGAGSFATLTFGLFPYFFGARPSRWRLRGLLAMLGSFKWIDNPVGISYFSQVPYRYGEHAVKFCVRPQQPSPNLRRPRFLLTVATYVILSLLSFGRLKFAQWENLLRTALLKQLRENEVRFDFMIQIGTAAMPIDDAVIPWDERLAPFVKVATIAIDRLPDDFEVETMMQFGEHLSFTPWHALPAHEPLGSINAARRHVYDTISKLRHRLNRRVRREPRTGETAPDYLRSIQESDHPVS
jgi:hypothetical protein